MVSSTQLSDCIARSLGLSDATVALHMRNIREEGILTQGGRGRSAARMSPADGSALLISTVGSLQPKDSVESFNTYGSVKRVLSNWETDRVPSVDQLDEHHTFHDALSALIEAFVFDREAGGFKMIQITMHWPWIGSRIECFDDEQTISWIQYGRTIEKKSSGGARFTTPFVADKDLHQRRTFSETTIVSIANLLRGST